MKAKKERKQARVTRESMISAAHMFSCLDESIYAVEIARLTDKSNTRIGSVAVRVGDLHICIARLRVAGSARKAGICSTDMISSPGETSGAGVIAHCSSDPVARAV